jgi:hypothetical protein
MSSNYEWQKQQVNQRINSRMREAAAERQAGATTQKPGLFARLAALFSARRPAKQAAVRELRRSEAQQ